MKKNIYSYFLSAVVFFTVFGCKKSPSSAAKDLPKVAIAGLAIESSTFSPAQTEAEAFHARRGQAVFDKYPFMKEDSPTRARADWYPALQGHAVPGGIVTRETYESLVTEMIDSLKKNAPYDGLFFDIHGAMSVVGLQDAEGDMLSRIREALGNDVLISTSMD
ncbi:MAG: M81 family metallopeptidase, partial [Bacteroidales bacterium]